MSLNTKPPDYSTMTNGQLRKALENQLFLKNKMSGRLPDSGRKLDLAIERIKSIMEEKKQLTAGNFYRKVPSEEQLLSKVRQVLETPKLQESKMNAIEEEWDEILEDFQSLNLGAKNPLLSDKNKECMDSVPHLTQLEVDQYRRLCNLPCLHLSERLHWFAFRLHCLEFAPNLVCLTVVDCLNPARTLTRCGALSTWPIYRPSKQKKMLTSAKSHLGAPTVTAGEALHDLWSFIGDEQEQSSHQSILFCNSDADDEVSDNAVNRLRRLFCSARHYTAARSGMSRSTLFLCLPIKCVSESDEVKNQPTPTCLKDALTAEVSECQHQCSSVFIDGNLRNFSSTSDLFKVAPPKSTAWIEAPLNLIVLRNLALAETSQTHVAHSSVLNEPVPVSILPPNEVEGVLGRLAGAGLSPTSLSLLAGVGGWRGFAGFLSSAHVIDDLHILRRLYMHFTHVYKGLALNASCFEENEQQDQKNSQRKGKLTPLQDNRLNSSALTSSATGSAISVCAWTGSPLHQSTRQVKSLSMAESIEMMRQIRQNYQEFRTKANLFDAPSMPPKSVFSKRYREPEAPTDSDDTLTGSESENSGSPEDEDDGN